MKDYEKLSKKHFNNQAPTYDDTNTVYYSKYPKISCKDVAKRLQKIKYSKLLDIGCGTGFLIDILRKENSNAIYYGLDLSPEMLKVATSKFEGSVELTEGSALNLPYKDNSFDIVTCIQSFHHYPDPYKALNEAYRVTKKGGKYIISDTGCSGFGKWFDNKILMRLMNSGDYQAYDSKDISFMLQKVGFKIESCSQIDKFIYTIIAIKD